MKCRIARSCKELHDYTSGASEGNQVIREGRNRRNRIEVSAALPSHGLPLNQAKVSFVDQSRGLQDLAGILSAQVYASQAAQF